MASNFAYSICGNIPIVYHHIEEWSKHESSDEKYLIAISDKCRRGIYGEGGVLFSKEELYYYKENPKKPQKRQVDIIIREAKMCENLYSEICKKIDAFPNIYGFHKDIDFDDFTKKVQKDNYRIKFNQYLMYDFSKKFKWDFPYYSNVLSKILDNSPLSKALLFSEEKPKIQKRSN